MGNDHYDLAKAKKVSDGKNSAETDQDAKIVRLFGIVQFQWSLLAPWVVQCLVIIEVDPPATVGPMVAGGFVEDKSLLFGKREV